MMSDTPTIRVTSPSFSANVVLRRELAAIFPNVHFNDDGKRLLGEDLIAYLMDADGVVLGLEPIDVAVLQACPRLRFIAKYGVGLDNVDVAACGQRGVGVGWTGGVNRRSAAELALSMMLGLCRNVFVTSTLLRNGVWRKEGGVQLTGRTVGMIGVGNIGKELAKLLVPFHCVVLANDIVEQADYYREHGLIAASKEEIYRRADVVTLHVPWTPATQHLLNRDTLAAMQSHAFLINTSRGEVVDQAALKAALQQGVIAGAAIDVYELEPPNDLEFLKLPNLVCTPHIGGNALEAVLAMGRSAIAHLARFFVVEHS